MEHNTGSYIIGVLVSVFCNMVCPVLGPTVYIIGSGCEGFRHLVLAHSFIGVPQKEQSHPKDLTLHFSPNVS